MSVATIMRSSGCFSDT